MVETVGEISEEELTTKKHTNILISQWLLKFAYSFIQSTSCELLLSARYCTMIDPGQLRYSLYLQSNWGKVEHGCESDRLTQTHRQYSLRMVLPVCEMFQIHRMQQIVNKCYTLSKTVVKAIIDGVNKDRSSGPLNIRESWYCFP